MSYLIGVVGLVALAALYVGLGLADRGRAGCGGCALRELETACGACSSGSAGEAEEGISPPRARGQGREAAPWESDGDEWKRDGTSRGPGGGWGR